MNPVFVFLVVLGAALLWLLCSFAFRLIGMITGHLVDNAKKALDDEPSNAEMFAKGIKDGMKGTKAADTEEEDKQ